MHTDLNQRHVVGPPVPCGACAQVDNGAVVDQADRVAVAIGAGVEQGVLGVEGVAKGLHCQLASAACGALLFLALQLLIQLLLGLHFAAQNAHYRPLSQAGARAQAPLRWVRR